MALLRAILRRGTKFIQKTMIKPNPTIEPLREDLKKLVPDSYLLSTPFKRWMVLNNLQDLWKQCLDYSNSMQSLFALGYMDEIVAGDALTVFLNNLFVKDKPFVLKFIFQLLACYRESEKKELDVTNLRQDFMVAGYAESDLIDFDIFQTDSTVEENSQDKEVSKEEEIRESENVYLQVMNKDPNSHKAIDAYHEWYTKTLLYLSDFYSVANPDFAKFKETDNSHNGYGLRTNYHALKGIYNLLMKNASKQMKTNMNKKEKTPMVFISHASKDKEIVEALVDLLEGIGLTKENLFCSSVDGYGIPLSQDIFETLRGLFNEHDLYVVFVHTPRFYDSHVCLNEMGAAWVLKTDFCSILSHDMSFEDMDGVVNKQSLSIKVDSSDAPYRLNELKDKLINLLGLIPIDGTKWERKRNNFLKLVTTL